MKINKIYKSLIAILTISLIAFSCLKDTYNDFSKVAPTAQMFGVTAGTAIAYSFNKAIDTVLVTLNVTGPVAPTKDVTLSLGVSQAAIDLYNKDTLHVAGTLLPLSSNAYTFPSTVTIKAGKDALGNNNRSAQFMLVLTAANIPPTPGVNYVIPIAITGAPAGYIVSSNQGAILYNFYHNPWDGAYSSTVKRYNFSVATNYTGWNPGTDAPLASSTILSSSTTVFASAQANTVNALNTTVPAGNANGGFGLINLKVKADNTVIISTTCPANDATCALPAAQLANLFPLDGPGAPNSTYVLGTKTFNLYYKYTNLSGTFRVIHTTMVHL